MTRRRFETVPTTQQRELPPASERPGRCFWTKLKIHGESRPRLVFIPSCSTAAEQGPEMCSCGELQNEVGRLAHDLHLERQRAQVAEEALERYHRRRAKERQELQRWKDRLVDHPRELVAARGAQERLTRRRVLPPAPDGSGGWTLDHGAEPPEEPR